MPVAEVGSPEPETRGIRRSRFGRGVDAIVVSHPPVGESELREYWENQDSGEALV